MALLADLFRPKWRHSDPGKRRASVGKLQDQELLLSIALNDGNSSVRGKAIGRIASQEPLYRIVEQSKEIDARTASAGTLSDQGFLERAMRGEFAVIKSKNNTSTIDEVARLT